MEINYVYEFVELVKNGNYQETADLLYISQSSLSRHIQSIENDLGVQLFKRTSRKVELNEFGKLFYTYATQIQALKEEYTEAIKKKKKGISATITIGVIPTMSKYNLTKLFTQFQSEYPQYTFNLIERDSLELKKLLSDNKCDFIFYRTMESIDKDLSTLKYYTDHLVAVLPVTHPLATHKSLALIQLKNESFLFLPNNTFMYECCMRACQEVGFTPEITFIGHNADNILDLVSMGMGIALLTQNPINGKIPSNVVMVDLTPEVYVHIVLAFHSQKVLSTPAKTFLNFYKEYNRSSPLSGNDN